jgi:hypothetical protein
LKDSSAAREYRFCAETPDAKKTTTSNIRKDLIIFIFLSDKRTTKVENITQTKAV